MKAVFSFSRARSGALCKHVRWMSIVGCSGLLVALLWFSPGCADLKSAKIFHSQAQSLGEVLWQEADRKQAELADLPPDAPGRATAQIAADLALARAKAVQAGVEKIGQVISQAENPTDPISQSIQAASPLLPLPLRGPILLGTAVLVAGLRSWRLKAALASVARGFQTALREDKDFQACFAKHANTFRSTQTPTAKRIIDQVKATNKPGMLPI